MFRMIDKKAVKRLFALAVGTVMIAGSGTLPVQIPEITETEDGSLTCSDSILYERGFGLSLEK